MNESLNRLAIELENLIDRTWNLYVNVADFQAQSQGRIDENLNEIIRRLQNVDQMKGQFENIKVPRRLLDYVDELQNPQIFTRDRLQQTLERNEEINGKNETLARFADTLAVELSSKFPTEMAQYRLWRSRPPGKD